MYGYEVGRRHSHYDRHTTNHNNQCLLPKLFIPNDPSLPDPLRLMAPHVKPLYGSEDVLADGDELWKVPPPCHLGLLVGVLGRKR